MSYIPLHCHTEYSNIRLLDCIIRPSKLIDYCHELGLNGCAITDHDCLSGHVKAEEHLEKRKKENPDDPTWQNFKLIFGNEIYLVRDGLSEKNIQTGEKFYHFILLAKDAIGHKQLREISSRAWRRSFMRKGMRRIPTYFNDLVEIIGKNSGHIIASTACIGGYVGSEILRYGEKKQLRDECQDNIIAFLDGITEIFGRENFFLEMQPSETEEQVFVNKELVKICKSTELSLLITTDCHYLNISDRKVHKIYLNSKGGDREVDDFYATTYIMNEKEIHKYMDKYIGKDIVTTALENTNNIGKMCENYSLKKPLRLPYMPKQLFQNNCSIKSLISMFKLEGLQKCIDSIHVSDQQLAFRVANNILNDLENFKEKAEIRTKRINEEIDTLLKSSDAMNVRWSAYLLQVSDYVDIFWNEGDTLVGPARGSAGGFYLCYLLGITQIDPTREKAPLKSWRFLNPERASVVDIDLDIQGNRRDYAIHALQDNYGEDKVIKVATFRTEKSKSALLAAARGLGIDPDQSQYLSSMVKSERGILHTLHETFYGDEEKGISPNIIFVNEMTNNYSEIWEVAQKIEGLINGVGVHAGGVIIVEEDFTESSSVMTTSKGDIISAFELHDEEKVGHIKIDALAVEALDKIRVTLDLLQQYDYIDKNRTLRNMYEETIGIYKLERDNEEMWQMVWENKIMSLFQMDAQSGIQGISLTKPKSVEDLAVLNSVIRLMAPEKGMEQPLAKYARFRNNSDDWDKEMNDYGLTSSEKQIIRKYLFISDGICESQESLMSLVQEPEIAGWSLLQADSLRKAIAKKSPKDYEKLKLEFFTNAEEKKLSKNLVNYVFNVLANGQRGYAFNLAHTLAYSFIGLQEMNLAYCFPIIFWNTANLIVDSGATDDLDKGEEEDGQSEEEEDYKDEDVGEDKKKETKTIDYGKISTALGKMQSRGITIFPPNINESKYTFVPDVERNAILFGIKGTSKIGDQLVENIIDGRPYSSLEDFLSRVKISKPQVINLIKAGAFDALENKSREEIMDEYIISISEIRTTPLNLQNMPKLIKKELIPDTMTLYRKYFLFNKYIKSKKYEQYYIIDDEDLDFFGENFGLDFVFELYDVGNVILQKQWDKMYKKSMEPMRQYLKHSVTGKEILNNFNNQAIDEIRKKYGEGSISKWEMESLGFYFHNHELLGIREKDYNIVNFFEQEEEPTPIQIRKSPNGYQYPIYNLYRISGTVIDKNKIKQTITLLTCYGVVTVKIWQNQFIIYDRQISNIGEDGKKHIIEKSWFKRGNKLLITGLRRGELFVPKVYKWGNFTEPFLLIDKVTEDGRLNLIYERAIVK